MLADAATGLSEIRLDEATGEARFAPRLLLPGSHRFVVRDLQSGRSSEVNVRLQDGSKRKPAPLAAAGDVLGGRASILGQFWNGGIK
jgi:hypothetical protein